MEQAMLDKLQFRVFYALHRFFQDLDKLCYELYWAALKRIK
jgi:hypothetical protein